MTSGERANPNDLIAKIAGGSGLIAIGMLFSRLFEYVYKMIVSRIGVEEFGALSLGLAIFGFASVVSYLGVSHGIRRYVPFLRGKNDMDKLSGVIAFALQVTAVSSLVFMALALILARPIAEHLMRDSRMTYLVMILFLALPFYNLKDALIKILLGFEKIKYRIYAYNIIEPAGKALFAVVFIALGWGIEGAFWAYTLSMVVVFMAALFFVEYRTFSFIRHGQSRKYFLAGEFMTFSLGLILSDFLILFMLWSDTLLIGLLLNRYDVGIYSAGMIVASFIMVLPELVLPAATPVIVSTFARSGADEAKQLFMVVTKWMLAASLPCAVFLALFGRQLLGFFFGAEYVSGFSVMFILLCGKLLLCVSWIGNEALMMLKKTKAIFWISLIAVLSNIALNLILIPRLGIVGSAIGTSISLLAQGLFTTLLCHRYFHAAIFNRGAALLVLINVLAGAISFLAWLIGMKAALAVFALYMTSLAVLLWAFKLINSEDRIFLAAFFREGRKLLLSK